MPVVSIKSEIKDGIRTKVFMSLESGKEELRDAFITE